MFKLASGLLGLFLGGAALWAQEQAVKTTHAAFQATDTRGFSCFVQSGVTHVCLEGILLNCPEQWVDPTPDATLAPWQMGGQWEIFIQGEGDDHAGTACWMGQNYGNGPGYDNYTNEQWLGEITRLNHDPSTGYVFRPGDRVRVTGRFLFYAGKLNINETHEVGSKYDFILELVAGGYLPKPAHDSGMSAGIEDRYHPGNTYKYWAVGGMYQNGVYVPDKRSRLYVPEGFPDQEGPPEEDDLHDDPKRSPVTWVVYSEGPNADPWDLIKVKHGPVARRCWYQPHRRQGLIVRMRLKNGRHIGSFNSGGSQ